MKKAFLITCIFGLLTQANISCKKEPPPLATPYVIAREDLIIFLPMDTCSLWGTVINLDINSVEFVWRKIAGPVSYQIESPRLVAIIFIIRFRFETSIPLKCITITKAFLPAYKNIIKPAAFS